MLGGEVIYELVYLQCAHTLVDFLCHQVEHGSVEHSCLTYPLYLLVCFDEIACGHYLAFLLPLHDFLVHLGWLQSGRHKPPLLYLLFG